jgi:hypothetical protein
MSIRVEQLLSRDGAGPGCGRLTSRLTVAHERPANRDLVSAILGHGGHPILEDDGAVPAFTRPSEPADAVAAQWPVLGVEPESGDIGGLIGAPDAAWGAVP